MVSFMKQNVSVPDYQVQIKKRLYYVQVLVHTTMVYVLCVCACYLHRRVLGQV